MSNKFCLFLIKGCLLLTKIVAKKLYINNTFIYSDIEMLETIANIQYYLDGITSRIERQKELENNN